MCMRDYEVQRYNFGERFSSNISGIDCIIISIVIISSRSCCYCRYYYGCFSSGGDRSVCIVQQWSRNIHFGTILR